MKRSRQVATLLMILSLALGLASCGGSSATDAPQAEEAPVEETTEEQEAPEAQGDEDPEEADDAGGAAPCLRRGLRPG